MGCLCSTPESKIQNEKDYKASREALEGEEFVQGVQALTRSSYYNKDNEEEVEDNPKAIEIYSQPQQMKQPTVELNEFNPIKLLGRGSFGKVLLVERKNKLYAMKILKKEEIQRKNQK